MTPNCPPVSLPLYLHKHYRIFGVLIKCDGWLRMILKTLLKLQFFNVQEIICKVNCVQQNQHARIETWSDVKGSSKKTPWNSRQQEGQ
jgi:hypothetical protein